MIKASKGKELVWSRMNCLQSYKTGVKSIEIEEERHNCFVAIRRVIEVLLIMSYSEKYNG